MNFQKRNTRPPPRFNKVRVYDPTEITRPSFRAGTTSTTATNVPRLVNKRSGVGNYNLKRVNFTAPQIKPRAVIDFGRLASVNTSQFGQKVQLSDKTLDKLFRVSIPDPSDKAWLAEKERLLLLGQPNVKPFGREQRTIRKRINFGEQSQGAVADLGLIRAAINEGFARTKEERAQLGAKISQLLKDTEEVKKLNQSQVDALVKAIGKVRLSPDWWNSFPKRIYSGDEYMKDDVLRGNINMFILAHIKPGRQNAKPLESWRTTSRKGEKGEGTGNFQPAKINVLDEMKNRKRYIDLSTSRVIEEYQALQMTKAGVDNGTLIDNKGDTIQSRPPWETFPKYLMVGFPENSSAFQTNPTGRPQMPPLLLGPGVPLGAAEEQKEGELPPLPDEPPEELD